MDDDEAALGRRDSRIELLESDCVSARQALAVETARLQACESVVADRDAQLQDVMMDSERRATALVHKAAAADAARDREVADAREESSKQAIVAAEEAVRASELEVALHQAEESSRRLRGALSDKEAVASDAAQQVDSLRKSLSDAAVRAEGESEAVRLSQRALKANQAKVAKLTAQLVGAKAEKSMLAGTSVFLSSSSCPPLLLAVLFCLPKASTTLFCKPLLL